MIDLHGQFPPIPTPYEKEAVSTARLEENLARWDAQPLEGYTVLGSNGEAPLLEEDERRAVIRAARRAIPKTRRLIVGTGRESTPAAIRATREAFDLGADAVLVGVPAYYKPEMKDAVLEAHYRAVADASPGPVLLYSVPQFTGIPLSVGLVTALSAHPGIAGIKDSSGETENLRSLVAAGRAALRPFAVLVGSARIYAEGLVAGAAGGVLAVASVAPRLCAEIAAAARRGDLAAALAANGRLAPLAALVTRVHGIGGLKAALDLLGWHGGEPRAPLRPASAAARQEIAAALRDLGLIG